MTTTIMNFINNFAKNQRQERNTKDGKKGWRKEEEAGYGGMGKEGR